MGPGRCIEVSESTTRLGQAVDRFVIKLNLALSTKICSGRSALTIKKFIEEILRNILICLNIVSGNFFIFQLSSKESIEIRDSRFFFFYYYYFCCFDLLLFWGDCLNNGCWCFISNLFDHLSGSFLHNFWLTFSRG